MRAVIVCCIAVAGLLSAAPALAQTQYTWTGYGQGQGSCTRYKMTIDVSVTGNQVSGTFMQEGRTQRFWNAVAMDAGGNFRTTARVGDGNTMQVRGRITPAGGNVLLDGYCKFDAKQLTRK
ncbi:MAG: hypothetical protein KF889_14285 [Alphaproteobacteria bacterium]|nr:hypothetical protein [Alphaproteobacteria bacterium]MCW5738833.1 hypothetical protein [Alphaproteobacteria bacterium]